MDRISKTVAIGHQDFETVRLQEYFYIDKTNFIKEWWENGDSVILIIHPRRLGKTLNLSMLEKFFRFSSFDRKTHPRRKSSD
ncbi:MAG: AAA family ATPase [Lachnospiraceae bacterium]|nr:AAA family ATPase [Lachnospiraceae bacterium]